MKKQFIILVSAAVVVFSGIMIFALTSQKASSNPNPSPAASKGKAAVYEKAPTHHRRGKVLFSNGGPGLGAAGDGGVALKTAAIRDAAAAGCYAIGKVAGFLGSSVDK